MKSGKHRQDGHQSNSLQGISFAVRVNLGLLLLFICTVQGQAQKQDYPPCDSDSFCICRDHQVGDLLPDCDDCSGYIYCGLDVIQKMKCSQGEIFVSSLSACVPGTCPRRDCTNRTNPMHPAKPTKCSNKDGVNLDIFCICRDHQVGDLLPDCDDCSGYIYCGLDVVQKMKCSQGEIFDSSLSACVPGTCPRSDCTNTENPGDPVTPAGCTNKEVNCSFHGQILPHGQHCRLFWTCVEGCPMLGFCELGMWFDREKFVCDYPSNVRNCPINQD
ncbi:peritrophin-48 [Drosophila miranda]|uniref:peritrophin-48 n=1 Tax=Drosophila miranda TaxID=7229 RepID=UPI00143F7DE9|nr:peritrophin-48 [Drosophila miranda]